MGLFDHWPYTNFHELNLSWLLRDMLELSNKVNNFVALNTIKYADPIQWSITTQYEANTVVIDPQTGIAYLSKAPVPTGVNIGNTDYWSVIFDLSTLIDSAAYNFTTRVDNNTATATFSTPQGKWLIWNNELYLATVPISAGDTYVVGSNITRVTVEDVTEAIYDTFNSIIGSLPNLTTTDKSNIVAAINEVVNSIATLDTNLSTAISSLENMLVTAISTGNEGDNVNFSHAYAKDNIIWWNGGLYKIIQNVSIGDDISSHVTSTSIAAELMNSYGILEHFRDKKILIAGDSLSNETVSPPNWVTRFRAIVSNVNCTVDNISFGGSSWADGSAPDTGMGYTLLQKDISSYDMLIIEEGTNDCTGQIPLGSWSTTSGRTTFIGTMWEVFSHVAANNPDLEVYWIIPPKRVLSNIDYPTPIPLNVYRAAIANMCNYFNWKLIDWNCGLNNLNPSNANIKNNSMPDGLHISATFAPYAAAYMIQKLVSGGDTAIGDGVQDQAEYTSFDSANVSGVLRFLYDVKGNIEIEFQLNVTNLSAATKLISLSDDSAPVYPPFMITSASRNFYSLEYITDGWYIVPYGTVASDTIIGQITISMDKIKPKGSWSF